VNIDSANSASSRAAEAPITYNYPVEELNQANININAQKDRPSAPGRFMNLHAGRSGPKNKALLEIVLALMVPPVFVCDNTEIVA